MYANTIFTTNNIYQSSIYKRRFDWYFVQIVPFDKSFLEWYEIQFHHALSYNNIDNTQ
jgi:hypothetical protein